MGSIPIGSRLNNKKKNNEPMCHLKVCTYCKQTKPLSAFYNHRRDSKTSHCRTCATIKQRLWREKNDAIGLNRKYQMKRFGLTPEDYQALLVKQDYRCAICRSDNPRSNRAKDGTSSFAIDHDHNTGKVRSLLCRPCNVALGLFQDNSDLLRKAVVYVDTHKEETL